MNVSDNRLSAADGYQYDSAGNTSQDPQGRKFTYDAENKQVKVETLDANGNVAGTIGEYSYDGDGRRVWKYVPSTGETTVFVYDAGGKLVAEYSTTVATQTEAKVAYLTADHLGSPRINTDQSGAVTSRHDYHPFGEEVSTQQRTTHPEYAGDQVRKQFTGYERDKETEFDFAQARYYVKKLGRFTSVDPENYQAFQDLSNPQSWNGYAYVNNNPCNDTDPTGRSCGICQRFKNWWNGYGLLTDEQVETEFQKRLQLVQIVQQKGWTVNGQSIDVGNMSRRQIWDTANTIREYVQNHPLEFPPVEVEVNENGVPTSTPEITINPTDIPGGRGGTISSGGMPPKPPTPRGMSIGDFGRRVMKWGTGSAEARARIASLSKQELEAAGVTRKMAEQWRDFYREVARITPRNPSAAGRADLMQKAAELLEK